METNVAEELDEKRALADCRTECFGSNTKCKKSISLKLS